MICRKCGKDYAHLTKPLCKQPQVIKIYGGWICSYCCLKCKLNKNGKCTYIPPIKEEPKKIKKKRKIAEIKDDSQINIDE